MKIDRKKLRRRWYLARQCFFGPLIAAGVLLLLNLGVNAADGSEGRWLVVAREMLQTGDYWHATINFYPYPDKPLLTYWFITFLSSVFNHHNVTEFIGRLPSVIAALGCIALTIEFARRLFTAKIAKITGYLMATSYSVIWYGRLAEADMANMFFIMAAVTLYVVFRSHPGFWLYLSVGLCCAVGAHAKGMAAFSVPALVIAADWLVFKRWKTHLRWSLLPAVLLSATAYLLPFLAANLSAAAETVNGLGGFALALKENIVRFVAPFDHKEPFYAYLIHMPRHLAPWSLLFIPALIGGIRDFKRQSRNMRFLMLGIGLIFLFFSLSGSKRHYYILPIVPFSLVFTAAYLGRGEGASADILFKIKRVLLFCLSCVTPLLVFGMMTMVLMLEFFPDFHPVFDEISGLFDDAVPMSLALALAMLSGAALLSGRRDRWLPTAILSIWLLSLFVYGYLMPRLSALRTDRKFLQEVRACLREQPQCAETLTFAGLRNVDATYYLDLPRRIPAVGVEFSAEDLIQKPQVRWLLGEKRAFENWPTAVQGNTMVLLEEDSRSWEKNDRKQAKKMQLRVLMPPMTD